MKEYNLEIKQSFQKKKFSKEDETRIKIKEYFTINKTLIKNNFNNFLKFIGLEEIWSTEDEQKLLWDKIAMYSIDKNNIDYEAALCGISDFLEEEDEEEDIDERKDKNNKLSYNNIENDSLLDIDLQSLHRISKVESDDNIEDNFKNEKFIDEFINLIKDKPQILYGIKFINELYFNKYLNEDNIENEFTDNYLDSIIINKRIIYNDIKNKYKFIEVPNHILQNYFNYISKNNENKNDEIDIDKSLIEHINIIKIPLNNTNLNDNNSIKDININKNIEQLILFDNNIINCIKTAIDFNTKKLFNLLEEYIEFYIKNLKNSIYNEIKIKMEKKKKSISNNNINAGNQNLKEENKKLKKQIEVLIKENLILSNEVEENNLKINNEKIIQKNQEKSISPINNNIDNINNNINLSKNRNKIIIPPLKFKDNKENKIKSNECNNNSYINTNNNAINCKNDLNNSKSPNKLLQTGTTSFNDLCIDDLTNSQVDFSMNLNNITDQFLLDTTRLCNEGNDKNSNDTENKKKYKERIKYSLSNKDDNLSNNLYSDRIDKLSQINKEKTKDDFDDYDEIIINQNNSLTDRDTKNNDFKNINFLNIKDNKRNNNYYKAQSFYSPNINNNPWKKKHKYSNEDIFYGYMNKAIKNFFDFKYLSHNHKIKKLFMKNKEKLINDEFLSDEINAYFINNKKKKYILLISYQAFYFLKNDESLECTLRMDNKSLETIVVSTKNFNLLLLSFTGGTDIIIETYQRIEILTFLQKIIDKEKFNENLKISSSTNFFFHKKNKTLEQISTLKNKMFAITPNFENSQKIGVLLKYKESFFSASFHEKLIVLSSIGLMYFDDNCKTPKDIIPIVGTSIKFIVVQANRKIYCIKMKTINDEEYIFGSLQKREIFDWLRELAHFKKVYHLKMKQINPNFINKNSKEISNNINIMKTNNYLEENILL